MTAVNAELVDEIKKRAVSQCVDLAMEMMESQTGVGDHNLDRAERIARFEDFAATGVLDALIGIGATKTYEKLLREYRRDVANSALVNAEPSPELEVL